MISIYNLLMDSIKQNALKIEIGRIRKQFKSECDSQVISLIARQLSKGEAIKSR